MPKLSDYNFAHKGQHYRFPIYVYSDGQFKTKWEQADLPGNLYQAITDNHTNGELERSCSTRDDLEKFIRHTVDACLQLSLKKEYVIALSLKIGYEILHDNKIYGENAERFGGGRRGWGGVSGYGFAIKHDVLCANIYPEKTIYHSVGINSDWEDRPSVKVGNWTLQESTNTKSIDTSAFVIPFTEQNYKFVLDLERQAGILGKKIIDFFGTTEESLIESITKQKLLK